MHRWSMDILQDGCDAICLYSSHFTFFLLQRADNYREAEAQVFGRGCG